VITVFGFHLSRFYLSVEVCSHHTEGGNSLQHCKDVAGWLTAPRVQMEEGLDPIVNPAPTIIESGVTPPADTVPDVSLPPPFHPPRFLS
jgi:hypothetical protein